MTAAAAAALLSLTQSFTQLSLENLLALSGCFSRLLLARGKKVGVANEVPLSRLLVKSFSPLIFFVHPTAARLLPASHKLLHT